MADKSMKDVNVVFFRLTDGNDEEDFVAISMVHVLKKIAQKKACNGENWNQSLSLTVEDRKGNWLMEIDIARCLLNVVE